jgi:hypothetical protein
MFRFVCGFLCLGAAAAVGVATVNADISEKNRYLGEARPLGQGKVWTWIQTDNDGVPETIGITMTESALQGLPTEGGHGCCGGNEYSLPLPAIAVETPFQHVVINWNPQGHPPAGIYDKPHFDFHFYTMSEAERLNIKDSEELAGDAGRAPAPEYLPKGYLQAPGIVGKMGSHWVDSLAPEFNGQLFTTTFLYGSYNGRVTFVEPMLTKAFLESHPHFSQVLKQPLKSADSRFVAGAYRVEFNETTREYTIAIDRANAVK